MRQAPQKIGVILPGGGCNCCFQVGALRALCEMFPEKIAYLQAVSGGALNAAKIVESNFQANVLEAIWRKVEEDGESTLFPGLVAAKNFFGIETPNKRLLQIVKELDLQKVIDSNVRLDVIARNTTLDQPQIFSNQSRNIRKDPDFFKRALLASASIPAFMPVVPIDGENYSDGFIVLPVVAAEKGCDRYFIIISDHDNGQSGQVPLWFVSGARRMTSAFNFIYTYAIEMAVDNLKLIVGKDKVSVIKPTIAIPTLGVMKFRKGDISRFMEHGYDAAKKVLQELPR